MNCRLENKPILFGALLGSWLLMAPLVARSQAPAQALSPTVVAPQLETAEDYNRRLQQLRMSLAAVPAGNPADEYRIGANDLVEINIFEAPELNRSLRVSAGGEISMPLLGAIPAASLTARQLEAFLEYRLRGYMKDPRVGVFVSSIESHPVSVVGAVKKPGVFQLRAPKSVIEMLSLAEGISDTAGDDVLVMRGASMEFAPSSPHDPGPPLAAPPSAPSGAVPVQPAIPAGQPAAAPQTIRLNLKDLLESGDPRYNVPVYPGDIVKVTRAGIVYVVGEVKKPGGFVLKSDEKMSVLKAIALAEGLTPISSKSRTRILRGDAAGGHQQEIPIDLAKIFDGKAPDPGLLPADIVFVPRSGGKSVLSRGSEAAFSTITGLLIFRW